MTRLFSRGTAALLIAVTALTAACSNNDPTAPAAPSYRRSVWKQAEGGDTILG